VQQEQPEKVSELLLKFLREGIVGRAITGLGAFV
jgi:hypothetical protein